MVDHKIQAASVDENALQAGFKAAMDRVKEMKTEEKLTLIDSISDEDWKNWDATDENPILCDSDGINGSDFSSDDLVSHAA